jgi:hypothetical protein
LFRPARCLPKSIPGEELEEEPEELEEEPEEREEEPEELEKEPEELEEEPEELEEEPEELEEEPEELEEELGEPAGRDSRNPRSCWAGLGCAGLVSAGLGFYFLCTSFAFPFIFPRQVKGQ